MQSNFGDLSRAIDFIVRDLDKSATELSGINAELKELNKNRELTDKELIRIQDKVVISQKDIAKLQENVLSLVSANTNFNQELVDIKATTKSKKSILEGVDLKTFLIWILSVVGVIGAMILGIFDKALLDKIIRALIPD